MARLDYGVYLNDELYQHCMSGIDRLGVHAVTLRGQQHDIQNMCTASSFTIVADSAGKVQRQGYGNCGFYSILDGMKNEAKRQQDMVV